MQKILKDRLLVERVKIDKKNSLIDIVEDESEPLIGKILKIGKLVEDVKEGDTILFKESDSLSVTLDGKNYLILREYDIIAIL